MLCFCGVFFIKSHPFVLSVEVVINYTSSIFITQLLKFLLLFETLVKMLISNKHL